MGTDQHSQTAETNATITPRSRLVVDLKTALTIAATLVVATTAVIGLWNSIDGRVSAAEAHATKIETSMAGMATKADLEKTAGALHVRLSRSIGKSIMDCARGPAGGMSCRIKMPVDGEDQQ